MKRFIRSRPSNCGLFGRPEVDFPGFEISNFVVFRVWGKMTRNRAELRISKLRRLKPENYKDERYWELAFTKSHFRIVSGFLREVPQ
jgi:hypothetical protein